jgi:hypothetical protein
VLLEHSLSSSELVGSRLSADTTNKNSDSESYPFSNNNLTLVIFLPLIRIGIFELHGYINCIELYAVSLTGWAMDSSMSSKI